MNHLLLADAEIKGSLYPFTLTRSAADIRVGILTIREKWNAYLRYPIDVKDEEQAAPENSVLISANIIPTRQFVKTFIGEGNLSDRPDWNSVRILQHAWHIFTWNDWAIREDYELVTAGRKSAPLPESVKTVNPEKIFIEHGAKLSHCILNAESGPIYIGRNATVMEGVCIRGPVALCENAVVKMGATIYGATTIGPHSMVGGEIKNSVIFGYSNKAHNGYLGDSVVGEWCNLGAGTSNSNLKNNAGEVKMYNHSKKEFVSTGMIKCGVIIGDYSRSAINTSFNTGTTVGVCANVFGEGLTPGHIASFSWGTGGEKVYEVDKAIADVEKWMKLKDRTLGEPEKRRLRLIFDQK